MRKEFKIVLLFAIQSLAVLYAAVKRGYFAVGGEYLVLIAIYMPKFLISQIKLVFKEAME